MSQVIYLFFILCSLTISVSSFSNESSVFSVDEVSKLFKEWKEQHGKEYKHEHEANKRFVNFKNNLKYIIEKNSKRGLHHEHFVGLNKFADMSNDEFKKVYSTKIKKPFKRERIVRKRGVEREENTGWCAAPSALDWRTHGVVTGVKDQGDCGKCYPLRFKINALLLFEIAMTTFCFKKLFFQKAVLMAMQFAFSQITVFCN